MYATRPAAWQVAVTTDHVEPCAFPGCDRPARKSGLCWGHLDQRNKHRVMRPLRPRVRRSADICSFPSCDRTDIAAHGLCGPHYQQQRTGRPLAPLLARHPTTGACSFPGCEARVASKGLCTGHYKQAHAGLALKPLRQRNQGKACAFEGCGRPAVTRGLCTGHYGQLNRGLGLAPLARQVDYDHAVCSVEGCEKRPAANGLCHQHYHRTRRAVIDAVKLERGCADCGYRGHPAALDFHHIDRSTKTRKVSSLAAGPLERAMAEADKCIVLCANCHKLRHVERPTQGSQHSG